MSWLLSFLRELTRLQVGFIDLIDILTVAFLIYGLLLLLRGTRAIQMLWGIVIFWAVQLGASLIGLDTLSRLLREILVYLPFAVTLAQ